MKRYTLADINNNRFYQLPKFLFEDKYKTLSNNSRVLYSLLRDRHDLSVKNQWMNKNNEVYVLFSRENMSDLLGCSIPTIRKIIKELIEKGLIEEERMGLNKSNRIYLTCLESIEISGQKKSFSQEGKELSVKTEKVFQSKEKDSFSQEGKNLSCNDTDFNDTDFSDTNLSINLKDKKRLDYENYKEIISTNISYEVLKIDYIDNPIIDNIYQLIIEVVTSKKAYIKISGEDKPIEIVKSIFLKLNEGHIRYLIDSFNDNTKKIKNIKSYIITSLYNTYSTIDLHYKNCVNDFY